MTKVPGFVFLLLKDTAVGGEHHSTEVRQGEETQERKVHHRVMQPEPHHAPQPAGKSLRHSRAFSNEATDG